ncbi:MAG: hypothetical protein ACOX0C_02835 [Patescibacteria group bacterium]|jgi:hypothetical protein
MNIVFDWTPFQDFIQLPPAEAIWLLLSNYGWIAFGIVFLIGARDVWLYYIRRKWSEGHKWILLAIDIPKGNEQTPKAVENMFTYLGGAHGSQNFYEKWIAGEYQKSFSYEIVSLEGYTQFLIRTPAEYRNLIESSVYSQYPDAEISEVDDYVNTVPPSYPDSDWDIFGSEFILQNPWYIPIKTYPEFEYKSGPLETQFKDPMALLMDLCSTLRQGEQFWFQMIVTPTGFDWVKGSQDQMNKILGRKKKAKPSLFLRLLGWVGDLSEVIFPIWQDAQPNKDPDTSKTMFDLTPVEARQLEGIHQKSTKMGFNAKIRIIYVARKEVMNKAKVVNGFVGYIKQFISLDLNSFKPDLKRTMTKAVYFNKARRLARKKRNIFNNYINRSNCGREPYLLNIEELATLWHFPVEANVKSAMIQKVPGRKADAPSSLPIPDLTKTITPDFTSDLLVKEEDFKQQPSQQSDNQGAPDNLPFV